jgi:hypothetical protein
MRITFKTQAERLRQLANAAHCRMTSSCVVDENGASITRYGLEFRRLTKTFRTLPDLSGNAQKVRELMQRINRLHLSPIHIDDVIEDFLASDAC